MARSRKKRKQQMQLLRLTIFAIVFLVLLTWLWFKLIHMPGNSYDGQFFPLTSEEKIIEGGLRHDIKKLGGDIGARNFQNYDNLQATATFLKSSFQASGYSLKTQQYTIADRTFENIEVEITGKKHPDEIVILGGHYDTAYSSPGANDNASGAAAVLELAHRFVEKKPSRTLRFVEFVNEEPPFFWTENMGSLVYAKRSRQKNEKIIAMLSLETLGYYSEAKNSQIYPVPLKLIYPSVGNFVAFIGNVNSATLVKKIIASFRRHTQFPSEGAALPSQIPGIGWSDQWAFWQQGYSAVMVTDTAIFRYPYYHTLEDTPNKIDYERLSRVVLGLEKVVDELADNL